MRKKGRPSCKESKQRRGWHQFFVPSHQLGFFYIRPSKRSKRVYDSLGNSKLGVPKAWYLIWNRLHPKHLSKKAPKLGAPKAWYLIWNKLYPKHLSKKALERGGFGGPPNSIRNKGINLDCPCLRKETGYFSGKVVGEIIIVSSDDVGDSSCRSEVEVMKLFYNNSVL